MTIRARKVAAVLACVGIYGGDGFLHCNQDYQHGLSWLVVEVLDFGAQAVAAGVVMYFVIVLWQLSTPAHD